MREDPRLSGTHPPGRGRHRTGLCNPAALSGALPGTAREGQHSKKGGKVVPGPHQENGRAQATTRLQKGPFTRCPLVLGTPSFNPRQVGLPFPALQSQFESCHCRSLPCPNLQQLLPTAKLLFKLCSPASHPLHHRTVVYPVSCAPVLMSISH